MPGSATWIVVSGVIAVVVLLVKETRVGRSWREKHAVWNAR
jgi:hypothetical protein